jgi:hypothetical protein
MPDDPASELAALYHGRREDENMRNLSFYVAFLRCFSP